MLYGRSWLLIHGFLRVWPSARTMTNTRKTLLFSFDPSEAVRTAALTAAALRDPASRLAATCTQTDVVKLHRVPWLIHHDWMPLFLAWQGRNAFYYPSGWRWMGNSGERCGIHSSLPDWGVDAWLGPSLFVPSSEAGRGCTYLIRRRGKKKRKGSHFGFTN